MSLRLFTRSFIGGRGKHGERLGHDPRHLDVEVEGQLVLHDDVDVGLGELAVAPLLGPPRQAFWIW